MVSFLVFSDFHFFRNREYLFETCEWISKQIRSESPSYVVFCGDLNHTHGYVDVETIELMSRSMSIVLDSVRGVGAGFTAISGNHDVSSRDGVENVLSMFEKIGKVDTATTIPVYRDIHGVGALFCPYPPSSKKAASLYDEELSKLLDSIEDGKKVVVFAHWELEGIPVVPGSSVRFGGSSSRVVSPALANKVSLIVNGHYHHPVYYEDKIPPLCLVGSPCYHNYSDKVVDVPRGVVRLDLVDSEWRVSWIPNPCGPVYHTIHAGDRLDLPESVMSRMRVRVRADTSEEYELAKQALGDLEGKVRELRVVGKVVSRDLVGREDGGAVPEISSGDVMEVLDRFLSKQDSLPIDRESLLDHAKAILKEVSS